MTPTTEHADSSRNDGTATCAVCAHVAVDDLWCALVGGLVCSTCCARVRSLEPTAVIDALSHAEVALSPDEVARTCAACDAAVEAAANDASGSQFPS